MDILIKSLLALHIAAGSVAFVAAPVAMYARKGGKWHRRAGQAFLWGMAVALTVVVPLSILRPNPFLFFVALFSGYLVYSGYRALYRKRPDRGMGPTSMDKAVAALSAAVGLGMIGWALTGPRINGLDVAPMLVAFGIIGGGFGARDLAVFLRPFDPARDRMRWFFDHLTRMLAGSIATYTAVAVVNLTMAPTLMRWLLPTAIGGTGIAWVTAKYKRRFAGGAKPSDVATIKIGAATEN